MTAEQERQAEDARRQAVADGVRRQLAALQHGGLDALTAEDKEFLAARRSYLTSDQAKFFEDAISEGLDSMMARAHGPQTKAAAPAPSTPESSLSRLSVNELKVKAAEFGIDASKMKKADIVVALEQKLATAQ